MKKVFKTFLVFICLLTTISLFTPSKTQATISLDKKDLFTIIRTIENGKHYILIFLNNIFLNKIEEL